MTVNLTVGFSGLGVIFIFTTACSAVLQSFQVCITHCNKLKFGLLLHIAVKSLQQCQLGKIFSKFEIFIHHVET